MRLTGKQISRGEMMPAWYGVAYYEPWSDTQVVYPIPLNLLVRWSKSARWALKRGKKHYLAEAYERGRTTGFDAGMAAGERRGRAALSDELSAAFKQRYGRDLWEGF